MFKLESYITPILLSYVDKYIKNFRPEDSQVSLWGGEVSFHNLDLRLDVLEEELQSLQFSIVSGHIHELLIRVPWTKLASEPITVTINTIECIIKLKDNTRHANNSSESGSSSGSGKSAKEKRKAAAKKEEIENPPGYIQSVVNKIVGNITINCNNLILKYVEEDIVVSMNIKLLTVESADEEWKPAFTELSATQVLIRKLITLTDLTVCLDRRNAAGKIDVYLEPMLYRCSLELRFMRRYHNATVKQASTTRIDIHCNSMEFSMTSQQFPMLMRLLVLAQTLQSHELKKQNMANNGESSTQSEETVEESQQVGWAGWAWSLVPSILPTWDEDWSDEQQVMNLGHTTHIGVFVDNALFSFKVSESSSEKTYYAPKKLKYWPILSLRLQGCMLQTVSHNVNWTNTQVGISKLSLLPSGDCVCGADEVLDNMQPQEYFKSLLSPTMCHFSDSLLDSESFENRGQRRMYNLSWDEHMDLVNEEYLLSRSPALAVDILYNLEIPEDFPQEKVHEIACDLEYSNFKERTSIRAFVGPFNLRYTSGLVHRLNVLQQASELYDYQPYIETKPSPSYSELPPPSSEDYDALTEYLPMQKIEFTCIRPSIEFILWDHMPSNHQNPKKRHQSFSSVNEKYSTAKELPKLKLDIENIYAKLEKPMYPNRLVYTTCKLPNPPKNLLDSCYVKTLATCHGLKLSLVIKDKASILLNPAHITYTGNTILLSKYWRDKDISLEELSVSVDSINVTSTKPRFLLASHILDSVVRQNKDGFTAIFGSTLLLDSCLDARMEHLEFNLENMYVVRNLTVCTQSYHFTLESCKAFIIEPMLIKKNKEATYTYETSELSTYLLKTMSKSVKVRMTETFNVNQAQQVIILSGPEVEMKGSQMVHNSNILLSLTIQLPLKQGVPDHPALILFNLAELRISLDPLLCKWLRYEPRKFLQRRDKISFDHGSVRRRRCSEASGGSLETPRRVGPQPTSVHSSENQQRNPSIPIRTMSPPPEHVQEPHETQWFKSVLDWHVVWKSLLIIGDLNQVTIYCPTASIPALGAQNLQSAYLNNVDINPDLEIFVLKLPFCSLRSANQRQKLDPYIIYYPIKLPENIWTDGKKSFPWTISIWDFSSYTVRYNKTYQFIKPVTCNATIAVTTKSYRRMSADSMKNDVKNSKSEGLEQSDSRSDFRDSDHNITPGKVPSLVDMFNKSSNTSLDINSSNNCNCTDQLCSLGICVYLDTMPIVICMSEPQVALISSLAVGLSEIFSTISQNGQIQPTFPRSQNPTTPTDILFKESTRASTISGNTQSVEETDLETGPKFTVFIQWTLTKFSVKLYGNEGAAQLKLSLDVEDIVNSLDMQSVYIKYKTKIATASVKHYRMDPYSKRWVNGPYLGIVMKVRENGNSSSEDNSFASIIYTRARCGNVHNRWGAKKYKHRDKYNKPSVSKVRYLSELMVNLQSVDLVLSPKTLSSFLLVLHPLSNTSTTTSARPCVRTPDPLHSDAGNFQSLAVLNLPLIYLDIRGLRFIIPSSDQNSRFLFQDVFILQITHINLNPAPDNPICRSPLRPDLYQQAAQADLLNVPGSEIEDRQYQLTASSFHISACVWSQLKHCLAVENTDFNLRTMNENPALEWNNLDSKKSTLASNLVLIPVVNKFDLCIVAAPAMVHGSTIICGHAVEINCVSDLEVSISVDQVKLAQLLAAECSRMMNPINDASRSSIVFPYMQSATSSSIPDDDNLLVNEIQYESNIVTTSPLDSGVDVADFSSENIALTKLSNETINEFTMFEKKINEKPIRHSYDHETFIPFELIFTGGIIGIAFYQNHKVTKSRVSFSASTSEHIMIMYDKGYEASAEDYMEDNLNSITQPLIRLVIEQPNALISKTAFDRRFQVSIFDIRLDISVMNSSVEKNTPQPSDYRLILLETKPGQTNPATGVPPALITVRCTSVMGKSNDLDIVVARPIKLHFSVDRWQHLMLIQKKLVYCAQNEETIYIKSVSNENEEPSLEFCNPPSVFNKFNAIKLKAGSLGHITFNTTQLILNLNTMENDELNLAVAGMKAKLAICNRPEKIQSSVGFESISLNLVNSNSRMMLLHPWSFDVYTTLYWESWQHPNDDFLIQINVDSDCLMVNVGPEHIKILQKLNKEYEEIFEELTSETKYTVVQAEEDLSLIETAYSESSENSKTTTTPNTQQTQDQHYKDDLRAGAFQFVDASLGEEIPLPYQVLFWSGIQGTGSMSWRYPQPRLLTKVHIYPVPFQVNPEDVTNLTVYCQLEYYSEVHGSFLPYCQFTLSESKMLRLNMPTHIPDACSASVWRVLMSSTNFDSETNFMTKHKRLRVENYNGENLNFGLIVSPRALAACMRIDSFFSASLVPKTKCVVKVSCLKVNLFNNLDDSQAFVMPDVLKSYQINTIDAYNQEVMTLTLDATKMYFSNWTNESMVIKLDTSMKCSVLDYGFLTTQSFLEPTVLNFNYSKANNTSTSLMSKPIVLKFGPSIAHTLAITEQMWKANFTNAQAMKLESANAIELIPMTRYVICNDTSFTLSFGQSATDESVILTPLACNYYAWRSHKKKQLLRICVLQYDQMWSEAFAIEKCGKLYIRFDLNPQVIIIVDITMLSGTQKKITFRGQLDVYNMTKEVFEMKVFPAGFDKSRLGDIQANSLPGRSRGLSLILESNDDLFMRLRFQGLDTYWSGDIPLKENSKNYQPWLVKVPLQDKGQFLCVWCKILTQNDNVCRRILVALWPLYMIRSHLPMSTKLQIDTPALDVHLQTIVEGRGLTKQIYCPGTIDHSHQLTFQVDMGLPASNPYVPLNYSLIDQRQLFEINNSDIDESIKIFEEQLVLKSQWPFIGDDFPNIDWIAMDQPQTNVSVRYQSAGPSSCSLLLELSPWCIMLNTSGLHLSIHTPQQNETSQLPHYGVLTPPRLENTFTIQAYIDNGWHSSNPLQFSGSSNNANTSGFYMPKITGLIPQEGEIKAIIPCGYKISNLNITSEMKHDMRILHISSSHIIYNGTDQPFKLITFALRLDSTTSNPADNQRSSTSFHSFSSSHLSLSNTNAITTPDNISACTEYVLQPAKQNKNMGVPITEWRNLSYNAPVKHRSSFLNTFNKPTPANNNINAAEYGFFICLSTSIENKQEDMLKERESMFYGASAPLRVDCGTGVMAFSARRSLAVPCDGYSIPLLLTTHQHKGCVYLTIQYDLNPQLLIVNESYLKLLCAQATAESASGEEEPMPVIETPELCIFNIVPDLGCTYYTMPSINHSFPDIQGNAASENNLTLALANDGELFWCQPIPVSSKTMMCVTLPGFGDIKLTITPYCYTTLLVIQTVSEIEISAREIRSRLSCSGSDIMLENKIGPKIVSKTQPNVNLNQLPTQNQIQPQHDEECSGSIATNSTQSENRLPVLVKNSSLPRLVSAVIEKSRPTMRPYALPTIQEASNSLLEPYNDNLSSLNKNFSESTFTLHQSPSNNYDEDLGQSSSTTFGPNQGCQRSSSFFTDKTSVAIFLKSLTLVLMTDADNCGMDKTELCSLNLDEFAVTVLPCPEEVNVHISMSNFQIDNQLFSRGDFDFPVVMLGQKNEQLIAANSDKISSNFTANNFNTDTLNENDYISQNTKIYDLIAKSRHNSLISVRLDFEVFDNVHINNIGIKDVAIKTDYISLYLEDSFFTVLLNYFDKLNPQNLIIRRVQYDNNFISSTPSETSQNAFGQNAAVLISGVHIPKKIIMSSQLLGKPLRMNKLTINEINLLLSVHSSIRMYIALDKSPLHFGIFEKRNILTTHFKLGHSLAMHYLSGAIFGAGWVVGSLEILGSPSGLARSVGTGLKDFVLRPYEGMLRGPWGFLVGVAQGSTSLLRHVTAGTVNSLSKMAASVARNLDRLTLDTEHFHRTEELRRIRPQGLSQGLLHGFTGLGISILGAVGGIAHHPLNAQTAGGVVAGVGVGLVGAVAKPLSGAAELLALAGQGLLHGAGWNILPQARNIPIVQQSFCSDNANLKYLWKILPNLSGRDYELLYATEGTCVTYSGAYEAVALVLTKQALVIFDLEEDACQREISLNELQGSPDIGDPTLICFKIINQHRHSICPDIQNGATHNNLDIPPMDPSCRARVAQYIHYTSNTLANTMHTVPPLHLNNSNISDTLSDVSATSQLQTPPSSLNNNTTIDSDECHIRTNRSVVFYVSPQHRNHFIEMFTMAKKQLEGHGFPVF